MMIKRTVLLLVLFAILSCTGGQTTKDETRYPYTLNTTILGIGESDDLARVDLITSYNGFQYGFVYSFDRNNISFKTMNTNISASEDLDYLNIEPVKNRAGQSIIAYPFQGEIILPSKNFKTVSVSLKLETIRAYYIYYIADQALSKVFKNASETKSGVFFIDNMRYRDNGVEYEFSANVLVFEN